MDARDDILALEHQRPHARTGEAGPPARTSSELNGAVVAALEEGVIVLDASGAAVSANESACRILGLPSSAILGRNRAAHFEAKLGGTLSGGFLGNFELAVELELAGFELLEQKIERHDLGERCRMAQAVCIGGVQHVP